MKTYIEMSDEEFIREILPQAERELKEYERKAQKAQQKADEYREWLVNLKQSLP